jgi:hypothetical protein
MIQQFYASIFYYLRIRNKKVLFFLIGTFLFLLVLFNYNLDQEELSSVTSNLIQFSGIFSAILITYILSKVFQIRNEKNSSYQTELIKFANWTTDFRRIADILISSRGFWADDTLNKLRGKYKDLNIYQIRLFSKKNKTIDDLIQEFHKETDIGGAMLYLELDALSKIELPHYHDILFDNHDFDVIYAESLVENWERIHAGNGLWYTLKYKWHEYDGCFNVHNISKEKKLRIMTLCSKIGGNKLKDLDYGNELLAEVGNIFESYIRPQLLNLTYYHFARIPKTLVFTNVYLVFLLLFGTLIPFIISTLNIAVKSKQTFLALVLSLVITSFVYFLIEFYNLIEREVNLNRRVFK